MRKSKFPLLDILLFIIGQIQTNTYLDYGNKIINDQEQFSWGGGVNISLIGEINPVFDGIWFSGTAEDSTGFTIQLEGKTVEIPVVDGKFEYKNNVKLTTCQNMFKDCQNIKTLKFIQFDTSNVAYMWNMFRNCTCLEKIDVSVFATNLVSGMGCMFFGCNNLISLNLSNFQFLSIQDIGAMFYGCSKLETLDLSNFNGENLTEANLTFTDCSSLKSIKIVSEYQANKLCSILSASKLDGEWNSETKLIIIQ